MEIQAHMVPAVDLQRYKRELTGDLARFRQTLLHNLKACSGAPDRAARLNGPINQDIAKTQMMLQEVNRELSYGYTQERQAQ